MKKLLLNMVVVFLMVMTAVFATAPTIDVTDCDGETATEDSLFECIINTDDVDGDTVDFVSISDDFAGSSLPTTVSDLGGGSFKISWTPTNDDVGSHEITFTVSDSIEPAVEEAFSITVENTNDAPTITSTCATTATVGVLYTCSFEGADVDAGDTVTLSDVSSPVLPVGFVFTPETGIVEWTPETSDIGTYNIVIRVTDTAGLFSEKTVALEVTGTEAETFLKNIDRLEDQVKSLEDDIENLEDDVQDAVRDYLDAIEDDDDRDADRALDDLNDYEEDLEDFEDDEFDELEDDLEDLQEDLDDFEDDDDEPLTAEEEDAADDDLDDVEDDLEQIEEDMECIQYMIDNLERNCNEFDDDRNDDDDDDDFVIYTPDPAPAPTPAPAPAVDDDEEEVEVITSTTTTTIPAPVTPAVTVTPSTSYGNNLGYIGLLALVGIFLVLVIIIMVVVLLRK